MVNFRSTVKKKFRTALFKEWFSVCFLFNCLLKGFDSFTESAVTRNINPVPFVICLEFFKANNNNRPILYLIRWVFEVIDDDLKY